MNNEKRPKAAMERGKKDAPPRRQPGQGGQGSETRRVHNTTSAGANQEIHISQPAATQRARILAMLRRAPVSTLEARAVAIISPATRVFELKRQGYSIITTRLPNRVGVYHLVGEADHGE